MTSIGPLTPPTNLPHGPTHIIKIEPIPQAVKEAPKPGLMG